MQTEKRYQARMHAKSNRPREKKNPANSPQRIFFFFFYKNNKQYEETSYAKVRSNLCVLNDAIIEKQSLDLLFLSSPKIPARFSQENTQRGKYSLFLDCIQYNKQMSNQT
jgi:hypothetical protein